jgi:hypothetical protein
MTKTEYQAACQPLIFELAAIKHLRPDAARSKEIERELRALAAAYDAANPLPACTCGRPLLASNDGECYAYGECARAAT